MRADPLAAPVQIAQEEKGGSPGLPLAPANPEGRGGKTCFVMGPVPCRSGMEPGATAEPLDFRVGGGGRPAKGERANARMRTGNASRSCPCHGACAKDRDPQGRDALARLGWKPCHGRNQSLIPACRDAPSSQSPARQV